MSKAEIVAEVAFYRRMAGAQYVQDETRARYLAVAIQLEWMLSQRWRP